MEIANIILKEDSAVPLYWQVYLALRRAIARGEFLPEGKLPPERVLARQLGVSRVTVAQAYAQLAAEGFVEGRQGAGTFVLDNLPVGAGDEAEVFRPQLAEWGERVLALADGGERQFRRRVEIDFGFGRSFPHIFPYDIWRKLLGRYLSTDDVMLSRYGSAAGFFPLRQALAEYLGRSRGVRCTPEQIVIVSGVQQALDILARLMLEVGDEVLVETPGYRSAFGVFRAHGGYLLPMPVDDEGMPVERIPADCRARLLFVTPSNQFPRGGAMPARRRLALLAWARKHGALVLEDDYDGELRYDGRPWAALQGLDEEGRVVYLGTFSKVLFPALRLAYVVLPLSLVRPFVAAKGLVDRGAPTLTQAAVADFIAEGYFERHLRHLRVAYGRRRTVLVSALRRYLGTAVRFAPVHAGLHVMLYLPEWLEETAVISAAAQVGVGIYPGAPYHLQPDPPPSILLGFSGLSENEIEEGIRRLADVIPIP
ncbi:MAG: PLP-dependent aminotransferase family protein [Chloroflexi bacterium]|nr:MAG: PLP-dependent aminotransferase family protein [Chloroflexota bacterium]